MRLSDGVEWGLHCAALVAVLPPGRALSAARLAEYHGVPGAYLAKHLQALSQAGVLEAVPGPRGGYRLARPAIEITEPAFRCTEIRRRGPASLPARECRVPCSVHVVMDRADAAWRAELASVTLADLVGLAAEQASPRALEKGIGWLQEVLR